MTPIVLDILIIAVLILFIALGAHRGFILTLCSLVAVVVALVGANLVADAAAPQVAKALQPSIERSIQEALESNAQEAEDSGAGADVLDALREKGGLYEWAANAIDDTLESVSITPTIAQIAASAATTVAQQLARSLIFILAFLVILLAWTILSHVLDLVSKLPGIDTLNRTGGALLGFVKGLVIVYLAVWLLFDVTGWVSVQTMSGTHLFRFLTQHSPLELLSLI